MSVRYPYFVFGMMMKITKEVEPDMWNLVWR